MLVISNICKQFPGAAAPIVSNITFIVNAGKRVGLIGPNGAGKSTLLKIIMNPSDADSGSIQYNPPNLRIGYLAQGLDLPANTPIRDALFPQMPALKTVEAESARILEAMTTAEGDALTALIEAYGEVQEQVERLSSELHNGQGERILASLDLADLEFDQPVGTLSGGQKTRLELAAILIANPQLLILDEPTNHLDITALEWLETWLASFPGGALIVSHDRTFLDNTVSQIVALDDRTHTAQVFEGGYSDYVRAIHSALDKQWAFWRDQQLEVARQQANVERLMSWTKGIEHSPSALKIARRAKAKEKQLERYVEADHFVEKPTQRWSLKLDFGELPTPGKDVIALDSLAIGYDPDRPLLRDLSLAVRSGERVVLQGPNGHGKSTLLKTILGLVPPLVGRVRIGSSVRIGYLAQEQEILNPTENALDTLLRESPSLGHTEARSFLHFFLFAGDDIFRPVAELSFGERSRLMLALLVARGANVLILDEPINHLDVASRERFEEALESFQGSVLAVAHDRYFVDRFAATIWHICDGTFREEIRHPVLSRRPG